jgi:hypothetical protein
MHGRNSCGPHGKDAIDEREVKLRKVLSAPRWTKKTIVDAAARLISKYEDIVGREYIEHNGLQFEDVYKKLLKPRFGVEIDEDIDLGNDTQGRKILGRYDVRANTATLDSVLSIGKDDPRRIFTCWHEVAGHGALQGVWLRKQLESDHLYECIDITDFSLTPGAEQILERQANLFASNVAAPDWLVNYAIKKIMRPSRSFIFTGPCVYWLDVHGLRICKRVVDLYDLGGWIGSKISGYFGGLSAEALGYRIIRMGWVQDLTNPSLHLHRIGAYYSSEMRGLEPSALASS